MLAVVMLNVINLSVVLLNVMVSITECELPKCWATREDEDRATRLGKFWPFGLLFKTQYEF
jgi:hypothetical protein